MFDYDPLIRRAHQERRARNGLIRNAVIWLPLFLVAGGALLYFLFDKLSGGGSGTWFLLVVLSILSFLFGYQGIHALLDLLRGDITTEGVVTRRWARTDSLVMRSHYIRLDGKEIFRIDNLYHGEAKAGDRVRVRYYPYSAVVIELETIEVEEPEDGNLPSADRPRLNFS
jgi:hypothetical protein